MGDTIPIRPVGLRIINHPKFKRWFEQGYAKQLPDGLWLHYAVICTLLREAELDAGSSSLHSSEQGREIPTCSHDEEKS